MDQELLVSKIVLSVYHVMEELLGFGNRFSIRPFIFSWHQLRRRLWLTLNFLPNVWNLVMKLSLDGVYLREFERFEIVRSFLVLKEDGWGSQDLVCIQGQELTLHWPTLRRPNLVKRNLFI